MVFSVISLHKVAGGCRRNIAYGNQDAESLYKAIAQTRMTFEVNLYGNSESVADEEAAL